MSLDAIRGGLVVSVQAPPESPLRDPSVMAAIARAAHAGGAAGIRANGAADVAAIKAVVPLPLIGLSKRTVRDSPVYITPELSDALEVVDSGADIVAVDGTLRPRPGGSALADLIAAIERPVIADVDSLDAGLAARAAGAAAVATTLSGYTGDGPHPQEPDVALVRRLVEELDCPVIAEGRYGTPDDVRAGFDAGAHAVVVGTAISDALTLTRRFAGAARG